MGLACPADAYACTDHMQAYASLLKADVHSCTFAKFASSSWGSKIAIQKTRKSLTDFDRFKVMVARVKKSAILKRSLAKARK
eukprot:1194483-Prorocentrum_minimum.AAC.2